MLTPYSVSHMDIDRAQAEALAQELLASGALYATDGELSAALARATINGETVTFVQVSKRPVSADENGIALTLSPTVTFRVNADGTLTAGAEVNYAREP